MSCQCDYCVKWGPFFRRISADMNDVDKALLEEFLLHESSQSDDLGAAEAKLDGEWPGWEWMKRAVHNEVLHEALEDTPP